MKQEGKDDLGGGWFNRGKLWRVAAHRPGPNRKGARVQLRQKGEIIDVVETPESYEYLISTN